MIDASTHLGLVYREARGLQSRLPCGMEFGDLVSEGYLGLHDAAERFRDIGYRFSTFARHRIRGAMLDAIRNWIPGSRERSPQFLPLIVVSDDGKETEHPELPWKDYWSVTENRIEIGWRMRYIASQQLRRLVELHYLYGETQDQLSIRMGCSPSWISGMLKEARSQMRNETGNANGTNAQSVDTRMPEATRMIVRANDS